MPRLSSRCAVHSEFCFGAHAVASPPVWYILYALCCCCYSFGFLFFCSCALLTKLDCVEKGGGDRDRQKVVVLQWLQCGLRVWVL